LTQHYVGVTASIRACPNGVAVTIRQIARRTTIRSGQVKPAYASFFRCTNHIARDSIETDEKPPLLDSRRLDALSLAADARLKFYVHANGLYVNFIFLESKFVLVM